MNTIFGLIVLTGPLFLIVLWVPVCIALAVWVGRKIIKKTLPLRIAGGVAVFLVALVLPIADEIAGRIYFNHLFETEAGVKVYQTIELPAEYWDGNGQPLFMNSRGVLDMEMLGDQLEWRQREIPYISNFVKIDTFQWILYDKQSQKVLGEKNSFSRNFGWISNFSSAPNAGKGCRSVLARKYNAGEFETLEVSKALEVSKERDFILQIITPLTD